MSCCIVCAFLMIPAIIFYSAWSQRPTFDTSPLAPANNNIDTQVSDAQPTIEFGDHPPPRQDQFTPQYQEGGAEGHSVWKTFLLSLATILSFIGCCSRNCRLLTCCAIFPFIALCGLTTSLLPESIKPLELRSTTTTTIYITPQEEEKEPTSYVEEMVNPEYDNLEPPPPPPTNQPQPDDFSPGRLAAMIAIGGPLLIFLVSAVCRSTMCPCFLLLFFGAMFVGLFSHLQFGQVDQQPLFANEIATNITTTTALETITTSVPSDPTIPPTPSSTTEDLSPSASLFRIYKFSDIKNRGFMLLGLVLGLSLALLCGAYHRVPGLFAVSFIVLGSGLLLGIISVLWSFVRSLDAHQVANLLFLQIAPCIGLGMWLTLSSPSKDTLKHRIWTARVGGPGVLVGLNIGAVWLSYWILCRVYEYCTLVGVSR